MVCQKNYELDDGSGLIVMEDTQAIDTILDEHATMQSLGKDTGTRVQANAVYDLGRSDQNGSITYSSKAISENMVINNGYALTSGLAQWLTFQSEGMMAFLRS